VKLPLVGQSTPSRSLAISAQASINVFPQVITDPNDKMQNTGSMFGAPGRHSFATLATDVRGLWSGAGRLFVASGLNLIELNEAAATVSSYSYAASDDGFPVQIFSNGNQLLVITGGFAYLDNGVGPVPIFIGSSAGSVTAVGTAVTNVGGDPFPIDGSWNGLGIIIGGNTFTVVSVADANDLTVSTPVIGASSPVAYLQQGSEQLTAVTGGYMDGAFFVQRPPTVGHPTYGRQVNFSGVFDGFHWSGLDFFTKEAYPDNLQGILVDAEQLYMFGAESFEVWQSNVNASASQNPFQRIPGAEARYGACGPWGQLSLDGTVYFAGGDDRGQIKVYGLNGFVPVPVSTPELEAHWNKQGFLAGQAVAYAYVEDGMSFLCINFGSETWAYNAASGAWHQRMKWTGSAFAPYETNLHTFIPEWTVAGQVGVHVTAGTNNATPTVYIASIDFYDDDGHDICWQRALPYVYAAGKYQYFGRLELRMEMGTAASGSPVVTQDYSDDRGVTFHNPRTMALGTTSADSDMRAWLNRNGRSRARIFRYTGVGQSKVALIDCEVEYTVGLV
jgi:hypothetical protein